MSHKNILHITFLICLLLTVSCRDSFYVSKISFDNKKWNKNEYAKFSVNIEDTNSKYNLFISFENYKNYKTCNLWIFFRAESPSGNIQTDTMEFYLSDAKGKWFGKTSGDKVSNLFLYKTNILFPEKGSYNFILRQGMREKDTPSAESVGILINKLSSP